MAGRNPQNSRIPSPSEATGPLGRDELLPVLNELLEAERAGVKVAAAYRDECPSAEVRALLDGVHADEAHSCALLSKAIQRLGGEPSRLTGAFLERALRVEGLRERLAFLNRGQGWVIRRVEATIPRISDPEISAALAEMLEIHIRNVAACDEIAKDEPERNDARSGKKVL